MDIFSIYKDTNLIWIEYISFSSLRTKRGIPPFLAHRHCERKRNPIRLGISLCDRDDGHPKFGVSKSKFDVCNPFFGVNNPKFGVTQPQIWRKKPQIWRPEPHFWRLQPQICRSLTPNDHFGTPNLTSATLNLGSTNGFVKICK